MTEQLTPAQAIDKCILEQLGKQPTRIRSVGIIRVGRTREQVTDAIPFVDVEFDVDGACKSLEFRFQDEATAGAYYTEIKRRIENQ